MAKLALYFPDSVQPRVLDSDLFALNYVWPVGRASGAGIHFSDPDTSRQHARIRYNEESASWEVMDVGSRNGTYVNKDRLQVRQWRPLNEGDRVRFGSPISTFRVSYDIDETLNLDQDDEPTAALAPPPVVMPALPPAPPTPTPLPPPPARHDSIWSLAGDIIDWVQSPTTPSGVVYRVFVLLLFLAALCVVLILK